MHDLILTAPTGHDSLPSLVENAGQRLIAAKSSAEVLEAKKHVRGTFGTGDNEWFTPSRYINAAREVMGAIDLDPATHPLAQTTVQADRFFTREDNALDKPWDAPRVWLNPPYAQPLIRQFIEKLVDEIGADNVREAILLTHNYTDTAWFHTAEAAANLICFTRGGVKFVAADGTECAPTQGQAFFYYGPNSDRFREVFGAFGFVR
jgi:ParB family chromosome partitioning protein